ncbi:GIY-YIG nuclease family protein [Candidatus Peregrinibacteria bacterium]|nr:GIY-YIG nuclease family protein [Candidatus Peregrinibacteria bacterium]
MNKNELVYYAYVQQNPEGKWYKGHTSNLCRRRVEHLLQWSPYSKRFGPSKLVYCELLDSKTRAIKREFFFKTGQGRRYIKKMIHTESYPSG